MDALPVSRIPNETISMIPRRVKLGFSSLPNKESKFQSVICKMMHRIPKNTIREINTVLSNGHNINKNTSILI